MNNIKEILKSQNGMNIDFGQGIKAAKFVGIKQLNYDILR